MHKNHCTPLVVRFNMRIYVCLLTVVTITSLAFDSPINDDCWFKQEADKDLLSAIRVDDVDTVGHLLHENFWRKETYETDTRKSLLHVAAGSGAAKTAALLQRYKISQLERTKEGYTPLSQAVNATGINRDGYFATLDVLLGHPDAGRASLVGFKNNQSALDCIQNRLVRLTSLEQELQPAFKIDLEFKSGLEQRRRIMHHKALCYIASVVSERRDSLCPSPHEEQLREVFEKLCALRVDFNCPLDQYGRRILHDVCLFANRYSYTITRQLLAFGANPTLRCSPDTSKGIFLIDSRRQGTPLHVACFCESYACIAALLDHNPCLLYEQDAQCRTAAAYAKDTKASDALLVFLNNYSPSLMHDPAHAPDRLRLPEINIRAFLSGVMRNYIHHERACRFDYEEHYQAWMPFIDSEGHLHEIIDAAGSDQILDGSQYMPTCVKIIKMFMQRGADPDQIDRKGRTLLHISCKDEKRKIMPDLISLSVQFGANLNHKDRKGRTPLHCAIDDMPTRYWDYESRGNVDSALKALLENGADPNEKDNKGRTPLYQAVQNIRKNCNHMIRFGAKSPYKVLLRLKDFKLLLDSAADIYAQTEDGDTPVRVVTAMLQHAPDEKSAVVPAKLYKVKALKDKKYLERLSLLFSHYAIKGIPTLQFLCTRALERSCYGATFKMLPQKLSL